MSLLKLLGWADPDSPPDRLATAIQARLGRLTAERAEFVAAFAGLLVRVAYADRDISEAEHAMLQRLLVDNAGLSADEAETVAEIVTHQATTLEGISYASLTRAFNAIASVTEKERLIDCLYA